MNEPKPPRAEDGAYAGDTTPRKTWAQLKSNASAVLVDVRTDAEMDYVGFPELNTLGKKAKVASWVLFPGGKKNPEFVAHLEAAVPDKNASVYFLCRSGVRSRFAAAAFAF